MGNVFGGNTNNNNNNINNNNNNVGENGNEGSSSSSSSSASNDRSDKCCPYCFALVNESDVVCSSCNYRPGYHCPSCGHGDVDTRKFCRNCGYVPVPSRTCRNCRHALQPNDETCGHCAEPWLPSISEAPFDAQIEVLEEAQWRQQDAQRQGMLLPPQPQNDAGNDGTEGLHVMGADLNMLNVAPAGGDDDAGHHDDHDHDHDDGHQLGGIFSDGSSDSGDLEEDHGSDLASDAEEDGSDMSTISFSDEDNSSVLHDLGLATTDEDDLSEYDSMLDESETEIETPEIEVDTEEDEDEEEEEGVEAEDFPPPGLNPDLAQSLRDVYERPPSRGGRSRASFLEVYLLRGRSQRYAATE